MLGTPLPSIVSVDLALSVSTTPRGIFNAMMMTIKTPTAAECGTYDLESLFTPFAQAAAEGDLDLSKVITPASFYQLADSLSIEDMFEAAREANLAAANNTIDETYETYGVPDVDMNTMEYALASVPSSLVEDMEEAKVPSHVAGSRRSARTPLSRVAVAAAASGAKVTSVRKTKAKRVAADKRKRAPKVAVAVDLKDARYWARREKNNAAARRNRALKKAEKVVDKSMLPRLNEENVQLVDEVVMLKTELRALREALRDRLIREGMAC